MDGVYCPLQGLGRDVMNTATGTFRKANALELPYRANALCACQEGPLTGWEIEGCPLTTVDGVERCGLKRRQYQEARRVFSQRQRTL